MPRARAFAHADGVARAAHLLGPDWMPTGATCSTGPAHRRRHALDCDRLAVRPDAMLWYASRLLHHDRRRARDLGGRLHAPRGLDLDLLRRSRPAPPAAITTGFTICGRDRHRGRVEDGGRALGDDARPRARAPPSAGPRPARAGARSAPRSPRRARARPRAAARRGARRAAAAERPLETHAARAGWCWRRGRGPGTSAAGSTPGGASRRAPSPIRRERSGEPRRRAAAHGTRIAESALSPCVALAPRAGRQRRSPSELEPAGRLERFRQAPRFAAASRQLGPDRGCRPRKYPIPRRFSARSSYATRARRRCQRTRAAGHTRLSALGRTGLSSTPLTSGDIPWTRTRSSTAPEAGLAHHRPARPCSR